MTALQTLSLDNCQGLCNDHMFMLSAMVGLTSLSMQSCGSKEDPIGCWTLGALQHIPSLVALNLSFGHFTPSALLYRGLPHPIDQLGTS